MTKAVDPKSIEAGTGINWQDWMDYLDKAGARGWDHKTIARHVNARIDSPWWAQQVTIGYEQATGSRKPGQRADGSFSFSTSRIFGLPRHDLLDAWTGFCQSDAEISPLLGGDARRSDTPKRSVWRVTLVSGVKFTASAEPRAEMRAALVLGEDKIPSGAEKDKDAAAWKARLSRFASSLPEEAS